MARDRSLQDGLLQAIRIAADRPTIEWAQAPIRLEGGSWADTFKIRVTGWPGLDRDLVARVLPEPDSWKREMLVQGHMARSGFPAPAVHLGALPSPEFDRAWMLMDFDPGEQYLPRRNRATFAWWAIVRSWGVPQLLAQTAARIHKVDGASVAKELAMHHAVGPILEWLFSRAAALGDRDLIERSQRLLASRPPHRGSVLCHGDLHPLNILRNPGHDTVIDWTHAQYDDPLYDIAFTRLGLLLLPFPEPRLVRHVMTAVGESLARRFVSAYERESGTEVDLDRLEWFSKLLALRVYVEAAEARAKGLRASLASSPAMVIEPYLRNAGM